MQISETLPCGMLRLMMMDQVVVVLLQRLCEHNWHGGGGGQPGFFCGLPHGQKS